MGYETVKNLDELYSAIQSRLKDERSLRPATAQLIAIKNGLVIAQEKNEALLEESRAKLCNICRVDDLYKCDVETGWSTNCAFLKSNGVG